MFGKKKSQSQEMPVSHTEKKHLDVHTIPDVFYGGKDPEIYHVKESSKKKEIVLSEKNEKKEPIKKPVVLSQVHTGQITKAPTELKTQSAKGGSISKKIIIVGVGCLILFGVGAWYYVGTLSEPVKEISPVVKTPPAQTAPPPVIESPPVITPTTTDDTDKEQPTSTPIRLLEFPSDRVIRAVDLDADALTDVEEEIYKTDSGVWDTDGDGYYDGLEVANLYNPSGTAPEKIIDSGLVREYVNPMWQYRVYYPATWRVDAVDTNSNQVLFSTVSGDFIEVQSFKKEKTTSFPSWFGAFATGQLYSDLVPYQNRFQVMGFVRTDQLVGYYVTDTTIFVLVYHPGVEQQIMYPHVMQMMVASFRPVRTLYDIPDQPVLPQPTVSSSYDIEKVTSSPFDGVASSSIEGISSLGQ